MKKKAEKKSWKMERLNFENLIFWCFPDFLQNFAVNDFWKSFAECFTWFWVFSFLKIIFRHWIWNEIPQIWNKIVALKLFFCLLFRNGFLEPIAIFLALVSLKCICCICRFENVSWAVVALKIFFGAFLFENVFWRFSLRKCFFALVALKMIFCSCCCQNYFWLQSL